MHNNAHVHDSGAGSDLLILAAFALVIVIYIGAAVYSGRRYKKWPISRILFWVLGVMCTGSAIAGPLADRAHIDFTAHMIGHILLGMLAPIFLVLAAPTTLALRTLDIQSARRLSKLLKSWPVRFVSNPIIASILNIGGLWILYTTDLYRAMQHTIIVHALVHFHVFFAGYLFTASMIYIDPMPHPFSYKFRMIVFALSLAGHDILSKYIYAHPPSGVMRTQAESGGMFMYYAGDAVDLVLIFLLCYQWFKAIRPRESLAI
ncbi:cytochrome c oxidase assembly protein [Peribacillus sp. SI8-4]|uniref:cytochrome c oxidase assembly protein n=1 Tax=Peribacillus sp. SI8-4 TaxID=3048009 RepID=UPI0025542A3C|nr:cytochrome c oxidase assembly protein [Peribacillus sp. SI8-4]